MGKGDPHTAGRLFSLIKQVCRHYIIDTPLLPDADVIYYQHPQSTDTPSMRPGVNAPLSQSDTGPLHSGVHCLPGFSSLLLINTGRRST